MLAAEAMLGFAGIAAIAWLTWFFSFHPRLFVRVFVPREEWRDAIPAMLRDPSFCRGMRQMALLQFGVAAIFGLVAVWLWFAW